MLLFCFSWLTSFFLFKKEKRGGKSVHTHPAQARALCSSAVSTLSVVVFLSLVHCWRLHAKVAGRLLWCTPLWVSVGYPLYFGSGLGFGW